uniref:plasmid mobilization relaxosome protein MobC n=1 Tax=Pasteurella testudinis TaxID=761 RepID=UPI003CC5DB28
MKKKKQLAKCKNISIFIRKCVAEKEIYYVDLKPFNEIQGLLGRVTGSLNQTAVIYKDDIQNMKDQIENLSREIFDIHSLLLGRTKKS